MTDRTGLFLRLAIIGLVLVLAVLVMWLIYLFNDGNELRAMCMTYETIGDMPVECIKLF